jgi:hypothetical protein
MAPIGRIKDVSTTIRRGRRGVRKLNNRSGNGSENMSPGEEQTLLCYLIKLFTIAKRQGLLWELNEYIKGFLVQYGHHELPFRPMHTEEERRDYCQKAIDQTFGP